MSVRKETIGAFKWSFIGNIATYGLGFIISLILARLLSPEEFGLLGMAMVFIGISQGLMDVGFSSAVIQKQNVTQEQLSTVFYINLILSIFLTTLIYFLAGPIADFYENAKVKPIVQVISLVFLFRGLGQLQMSLFSKELKYDVLTKVTVAAVLISGTVAMACSYSGFGVWALVIQQLSLAFVSSVLYWFFSNWRPSLMFNLKSIKELFKYGIRLFASSVLESIYNKSDTLIIGKVLSPSTLGLYTRSLSFQSIVKIVSTNGLNVLFPAFSKKQDDKEMLREAMFKIFSIVTIVGLFVSFWLYVIAKPLFFILLGEKWIVAADFFQILMLTGFAYPVSAIAMNLIKAIGESSTYLKIDIIKKIIIFPSFFVLYFFGIKWFLYTKTVLSIICVAINYSYVSKLMNSSFRSYMFEIVNTFLLVLLPMLFGWSITQYFDSHWLSLSFASLGYFLVGLLVIYVFRRDRVQEVLRILRVGK